jgi:hypothetical protein
MYKKVQLPVSSGIYARTYIPKLATCLLQESRVFIAARPGP